ncbi:LWR-salt protein [Salarchaeum sp. III]|uniref:LWR-salt protein n=1 Tax=Salarchaeum sp. III TaxID=3107927 RepID=UPI002ED8615A
MDARYVFHVRFRVEPTRDVSVEPNEFETRMYRAADTPGDSGWLFFRDNLWRGELEDRKHFRELTEDALDVPVLAVEYRGFETDDEYYEAFTDEIESNLDVFKADAVSEVVNKYFGSSVEKQ